MTSSQSLIPIGPKAAFPAGSAHAVAVEFSQGLRQLIICAHPEIVCGFLNSCPHRGVRLDWTPGIFFELDGPRLQCATHGALFEPTSGDCVAGPCVGKRLVPVAVYERSDKLWVDANQRLPESAV